MSAEQLTTLTPGASPPSQLNAERCRSVSLAIDYCKILATRANCNQAAEAGGRGRMEVEEGKQRFHVTGYTRRGPCGLRCSVRGPMSEGGNKEK
jgi:hypothetical protein